jgi:hypothetical protein
MSYRPIRYEHISDPETKLLFHRAERYISDAYSMFYLPFKGNRVGGNCDFMIVLALLCAVDGVATHIYPTNTKIHKQFPRFKKLLREKLHWGPMNGNWVERNRAIKLLYVEFRNLLVHELGDDRRFRRDDIGETTIGRWGHIPLDMRTIDRIDRLKVWNDAWPTIYIKRDAKPTIKLNAAALYWSVKRMVADLATAHS